MPRFRKTDERLAIFFLVISLIVLDATLAWLCYEWHLGLWSFDGPSLWRLLWIIALGLLPFILSFVACFAFAQGWEGPNPKAFHRVALSLVAFALLFPGAFYLGEKGAMQAESVYSPSAWKSSKGYARYLMIPDFEKKVDLSEKSIDDMKTYLGHWDEAGIEIESEKNVVSRFYYHLGERNLDDFGGSDCVVDYVITFDSSDVFLSRRIANW